MNIVVYDIVATTSAQALVGGKILYNDRGQTTTDGSNGSAAAFNSTDITDTEKGLMYVMTSEVSSGSGISPNIAGNGEPLILRAAAGDWMQITLRNCFDPTSNVRAPFGDATKAEPVIYGQPQSQGPCRPDSFQEMTCENRTAMINLYSSHD